MVRNKNKTALLDSKPRKLFFAQTAFGTVFTNLTSGVFLSGLAMLMGAGDVITSYFSVIVNLCGVLILAFTTLMQRFKSRKQLTIALTVISKLVTMLIVAIPVIFPKNIQLIALVITVVIAFTLQSQTTVALNQWMMCFVDKERKGRYISLRQTLTLIVSVILSICGGFWLDIMKGKYIGFVILFSFALLMGIIEILLLLKTPDSDTFQVAAGKHKFWDFVKIPFKNKKFVGFVAYVILFYMILYIADSYTMVYMLKYLALPYTTVNLLYMIMSLPQIFLLSLFGKIGDKKGAKFVLKLSIWLFAGETLFMFFAGPTSWFIFIPIAFVFAAIGNASFIVSSFNRRYELMPNENRIAYDNFYTAAVGISFIVGPLLGAGFKSMFESFSESTTAIPFANIRLLYIISSIGLLILQTFVMLANFRKKKKHMEELSLQDDEKCDNCLTKEDISLENNTKQNFDQDSLEESNNINPFTNNCHPLDKE